jgi:hypothetical protein
MDSLDYKEKVLGGIFGIITIVAAFLEMLEAGITTASVLGAVKDISSTLIVVVLFITVINLLRPKKEITPFEDRLLNALEEWQKENSNMIVKKDNSDGNHHYGLSMKTDINNFFMNTGSKANAGWFVRLPIIEDENYRKENIEVLFNLNRGTYFENRRDLNNDEKNTGLARLADRLSAYLKEKHNDLIEGISKSGKDHVTLTVTLKKTIENDDDIKELIEMINTMYKGCLVASNIKL